MKAELAPKHQGSLWGAAFAGLVLLQAPSLFAQCVPKYSVEINPGPNCTFVYSESTASGTNAAGEICGEWSDCNHNGHGAVWIGQGPWQTISLPPGIAWVGPVDVNSAKHMAAMLPGSPNPDLYRAAFVNFPAESTTIISGLPGADTTFASALNDSDVVCGYSYSSVTGVPYQAYIWQDGKTTGLTLPFGADSVANDISDTSAVCGWMGDSPQFSHAFRWSANGVTDLGVIPTGQSANAYSISPNGQKICGAGALPDPVTQNLTLHAFYWSAGVMVDIGTLPGEPRSLARALNDSGIVVGESYNEVLVGHAFVWQNGVMQKLNDLILPGLNLDIQQAWAINNAGQIAAQAEVLDNSGDIVAVRLTPIPPAPGDFNCDDVVNVDDLLGVINNWGRSGGNGPADFNVDGTVNVDDLLTVLSHWG